LPPGSTTAFKNVDRQKVIIFRQLCKLKRWQPMQCIRLVNLIIANQWNDLPKKCTAADVNPNVDIRITILVDKWTMYVCRVYYSYRNLLVTLLIHTQPPVFGWGRCNKKWKYVFLLFLMRVLNSNRFSWPHVNNNPIFRKGRTWISNNFVHENDQILKLMTRKHVIRVVYLVSWQVITLRSQSILIRLHL
jgi:hypothetical protein